MPVDVAPEDMKTSDLVLSLARGTAMEERIHDHRGSFAEDTRRAIKSRRKAMSAELDRRMPVPAKPPEPHATSCNCDHCPADCNPAASASGSTPPT